MVAYLVGDHIGLGEITRGTVAGLEVVEEGEVEVHLLVGRAVERPDGRTGHTAGGIHPVAEQYQGRLPVLGAHLPENGVPGIFRVGENDRDEICQLLFLLAELPG